MEVAKHSLSSYNTIAPEDRNPLNHSSANANEEESGDVRRTTCLYYCRTIAAEDQHLLKPSIANAGEENSGDLQTPVVPPRYRTSQYQV